MSSSALSMSGGRGGHGSSSGKSSSRRGEEVGERGGRELTRAVRFGGGSRGAGGGVGGWRPTSMLLSKMGAGVNGMGCG